jgi:hypothetical protein
MMNISGRLRAAWWQVIDFAFGPVAPDAPATVAEITVGIVPMKKKVESKESGANDLAMVTHPGQLRRCAECDELARLYDVKGRHLCAKCAKKATK